MMEKEPASSQKVPVWLERVETFLDRRGRILFWLLFVQVLILIYLPSFRAPFLYDDLPSIAQNPDFRYPSEPWRILRSHDTSLQFDHRPVGGFLTFLNFQVAGLNPFGYRIINFTIHLLTAFCIAELIVLVGRLSGYVRIRLFAVVVAALWAIHPLNTMSTIYIYQRMESLMSLFAVVSLYALLRSSGPASCEIALPIQSPSLGSLGSSGSMARHLQSRRDSSKISSP